MMGDIQSILIIDFTNTASEAEIARKADEAKRTVALHQPGSLLVVIDFTGMKIDRERTKIIQSMAAHNRPYIKNIALVGLGFFRAAAFRVMLHLSGRSNHRVFGSREEAMVWLERQAAGL
jgi:hypothetical protein